MNNGDKYTIPPLGAARDVTDLMLCGEEAVHRVSALFLTRCEGLPFVCNSRETHGFDQPVELEADSVIQEDSPEGTRLMLGVGCSVDDEYSPCIQVVIPEHLFGALRNAVYQVEKSL